MFFIFIFYRFLNTAFANLRLIFVKNLTEIVNFPVIFYKPPVQIFDSDNQKHLHLPQ